MAKADETKTTTPRTPKSADERLQSALAGFAPVEEATVSEAETQRKDAERTVRNAFAGVVAVVTPANFGDEQKEQVAKAFSSLKRSQAAFLRAIKATSDSDASKLPGVVTEGVADDEIGFTVEGE